MKNGFRGESSLEEIQQRFDKDVERFSNLDTAQATVIDAPVLMDLITQAATASNPDAKRVLDIGCGAGNNTLKLIQVITPHQCDLVDLSAPMLERAQNRMAKVFSGKVRTFQGDFRSAPLSEGGYDIILAAAVLHHLRGQEDWENSFQWLYQLTAPGGSLWISDLVSHESDRIQSLMWQRYGQYLTGLGGPDLRDKVFAYIEEEDSPRSVTYQMELLKKVGYSRVDLLHKNASFAAFGAVKSG